MGDTRILISGGGIAGATLGYWLGHAGLEVTIVERTGERSSGNPVDVRGLAADVARDMGIWERLQDLQTGVERLRFIDSAGSTRASIKTRRGLDEVEVDRTLLAAALSESAATKAATRYRDSISSMRQDADGVDVEFAFGRPERFDLVIGADGLHSRVRRLVFGPEREFARPLGLFVATVRTDKVHAENPHEVVMFNEPGRSLSVHPAGGLPGVAFIFRARAGNNHTDPGTGRELVEATYRRGGWETPGLLKAFLAADDVYMDTVTRIDVPRWHRGRVALVGDAANCLSLLGEGSSNAIVGAKTLADALCATASPTAAFEAYEHTHRSRIAPFLRGARLATAFLVPRTTQGIAVRNAGLRGAAALNRLRAGSRSACRAEGAASRWQNMTTGPGTAIPGRGRADRA